MATKSKSKPKNKVKTKVPAPTVREFRHRAEVPMLATGILLTVLGILVILALLFAHVEEPHWLVSAIAAALAVPFIASILIRQNFWGVISNAVEANEKQYPEIYKIYKELALEMGMTPDGEGLNKIPRLYVANGNGVMNAYASKCQIRKGYIVIYSDLLDTAYVHGNWDTMRFVLAHELGHIVCRHVSIWRNSLIPVLKLLFLAETLTRAQEYTADRHGSYYAPEGVLGLSVVYAGKHMAERLDLDAYFDSVDNHKNGFWLKFSNFRATHAVGFRRLTTLRRVKTEGWDVHGKML